MIRFLAIACAALAGASGYSDTQPDADSGVVVIQPVAETEPTPDPGDAADDPAVWVHPENPELSLVIGTNKEGGLAVYDLDGKTLQYIEMQQPNNVDLRYGFPLADRAVDVAAVSERGDNSISVFAIDPSSRTLAIVTASPIPTGFEVYGLCMYRSAQSGKYYVFTNSKMGEMGQWELEDNGSGKITGRLVRTLHVGTQIEGCVADDELGRLYVGEETVALWRYPAEPCAVPEEDAPYRVVVDLPRPRGRFTPDLEGLAILKRPDGTGYLIASSQGDSTFAAYRREGNNEFVGLFRIGSSGAIDEVSGTDGIDVAPQPLGARFPAGIFVAQDDVNDAGNQNFKLVSWKEIAEALGLSLDAGPPGN